MEHRSLPLEIISNKPIYGIVDRMGFTWYASNEIGCPLRINIVEEGISISYSTEKKQFIMEMSLEELLEWRYEIMALCLACIDGTILRIDLPVLRKTYLNTDEKRKLFEKEYRYSYPRALH
ncbi:MAG: hypothetical protein KDH96_01845 [Candidatus Riesia sp.]|nr:hypothetical protein [Candidatus Riesia sp.]